MSNAYLFAFSDFFSGIMDVLQAFFRTLFQVSLGTSDLEDVTIELSI